MTSNRRTKKLIRSHMESSGLNYLEAKRLLEAADAEPLSESFTATAATGGSERYASSSSRSPRTKRKIIAVTSPRGGNGKTTVATGLATYLAVASKASSLSPEGSRSSQPLRIALVDLDLRDGQMGALTGYRGPTIRRLYSQGPTDGGLHRFGLSEKVVRSTAIEDPNLELDLFLAPRSPRSVDEIPEEFFSELLEEMRSIYDYVILDTGVNYQDPLVEKIVYPQSDFIILVAELEAPAVFRSSMVRWIETVTGSESQGGLGIAREKIGAVVNRVQRKGLGLGVNQIQEVLQGLPVLATIANEPKIVSKAKEAQNMRKIFESSELRDSFKALAKSIVGYGWSASLPEDGDSEL